jgi:hypothetical protein
MEHMRGAVNDVLSTYTLLQMAPRVSSAMSFDLSVIPVHAVSSSTQKTAPVTFFTIYLHKPKVALGTAHQYPD